jgi:hypothetical protein
MSTVHSIVTAYSSIERVHSREKEREETMALIEFQEWCKSMNIGSRVDSKDTKASELMEQYPNYTKWLSKI